MILHLREALSCGRGASLLSVLNRLQLPILLHIEIQFLGKGDQEGKKGFLNTVPPPGLFKGLHTLIQYPVHQILGFPFIEIKIPLLRQIEEGDDLLNQPFLRRKIGTFCPPEGFHFLS